MRLETRPLAMAEFKKFAARLGECEELRAKISGGGDEATALSADGKCRALLR